MSRVEVQIMGQSYVLASPDGGEDAITSAAAKVDAAMCGIRDAGQIKARARIAVLACLNMAFEGAQVPAASAPSGNTTANEQPSPTIAALIDKLDEALAQDGQLL